MKKKTVCSGAGMFAFGILVWLIGRAMGVVAILMPLIAVAGFIMMIIGLFEEEK